MTRGCPSCGKAWPPEVVVCPDCLVELVDDVDAKVRCRHCGREWPARMQSCPVCLAELRPDPDAAAEALGDILAAGGRLFRPDGVAAFSRGPAVTLLRLAPRGGLVLTDADGLVEAAVEGPDGRAAAPLTCRDHDGTTLFRVLAYEPAARGLVAVAAGGAAVATYLRTASGIDVRDETSAPVATLRPARGGFELVETGGGVLATVGSHDVELEGWVDDQWWLQPSVGTQLPLQTLGAVGLVVAAKILLGRSWPAQVLPDDPPVDWSPFQ